MIRRPGPRSIGRSAFTIIELLVVITIIAILISLLLAGVFRALIVVKEVNNRNELSQLSAAVAAFQNNFGGLEPPPSQLDATHPYLRRMFPLWDPTAAGTAACPINGTIYGDQALVFFLGGVLYNGAPSGFSSDPRNPFAQPSAGEIRRGPFFNFIPNRLQVMTPLGRAGLPSYLDYYNKQPFAYFSTNGTFNSYNSGDCPNMTTPYAINGEYLKPNSFQIISAGADMTFGAGGSLPATAAGYDDISNFSSGKLGLPLN